MPSAALETWRPQTSLRQSRDDHDRGHSHGYGTGHGPEHDRGHGRASAGSGGGGGGGGSVGAQPQQQEEENECPICLTNADDFAGDASDTLKFVLGAGQCFQCGQLICGPCRRAMHVKLRDSCPVPR